jgi:hypothetical protein
VREMKTQVVMQNLARRPIPESQVRIWAEVLALQMNHLSLPLPVRAGRLRGVSWCEAGSDGLYSPQANGDLRLDRRTGYDACQGLGVHAQRQAETAWRLAAETWL